MTTPQRNSTASSDLIVLDKEARRVDEALFDIDESKSESAGEEDSSYNVSEKSTKQRKGKPAGLLSKVEKRRK